MQPIFLKRKYKYPTNYLYIRVVSIRFPFVPKETPPHMLDHVSKPSGLLARNSNAMCAIRDAEIRSGGGCLGWTR